MHEDLWSALSLKDMTFKKKEATSSIKNSNALYPFLIAYLSKQFDSVLNSFSMMLKQAPVETSDKSYVCIHTHTLIHLEVTLGTH